MSTKLKEEFLKLLEEDREFRYTVAGLIGLGEILEAIRDLQGQVLDNIAATRKLQGQMAALQEQVSIVKRLGSFRSRLGLYRNR